MSKLLNPKVSENFETHQNAGALHAMSFSCALSDFKKESSRFSPRPAKTISKLNKDPSCQ
jgi:hypothetical protein